MTVLKWDEHQQPIMIKMTVYEHDGREGRGGGSHMDVTVPTLRSSSFAGQRIPPLILRPCLRRLS